MLPMVAPCRATRRSQDLSAWSRVRRLTSKLASTSSRSNRLTSPIPASTGSFWPELERTALPSSDRVCQRYSVRPLSQLATNSGSVTAARPSWEKSGSSSSPTSRDSSAMADLI